MTALALRDDQTQWDKQQIAVLQAGGIDEDVTEAELAAFLHECQRRKLDPFTRQIYLIGRKDKSKGRKVYRSQTSIDGFRLIARRAADKSGIDYSYEDTIWYDADGGRHEIWLSDKPPAGAKVVVIRNGSRFDAVARFSAYVQTDWNGNPTRMWQSMGDVMVAKCAEALALRKAFPEDLGGIYTEEEMGQADTPQRVTATAEIVRDEPAPAGDQWYVRDGSEVEDPWLKGALEKAPELSSLDACGAMWHKAVEKVAAGELTKAQAARVQDALRVRIEQLKAAEAASPAESEAAPPVAAVLDPEDPWTAKIEDISDLMEAEGALNEANELLGNGTIDDARYEQITSAIDTRLAQVERRAA